MHIVFLHPVFTVVTLILIGYNFLEVYNYKNYKSLWIVCGVMILLIGLRSWIGADYGEYVKMYNYFGLNYLFSDIFKGWAFKDTGLGVEWLYVLFGKIFFLFGLPFFIFTLFVSVISLVPKFYFFEKVSVYPALSILLYMYPSYFSADGGHMRQAIAMGLVMISFLFIQRRNLLMFLFILYIAVGFHKSTVIFLPAYWLAIIPMNSKKIVAVVLFSMLLSPLHIYDYFSVFNAIAPSEIYQGFSDYSDITADTNRIGFMDTISMFYLYFIVTFDKAACRKIPYYEYMRNISVVGVCLFYIFRGSPIFSTRLTAIYFIFMIITIPNILASVGNKNLQKYLHIILILYIIFYYFVYTSFQARAGYIMGVYRNYLW
ncbi:EpsG family protein [Riemerella columbipharyngis]|uniref:EpsG family protein n=1 Tax=Riemerella columbipharyngis TaxID=1071918 RepID=A0A1G7ELN3_9FLAO|nr:EpsG family protein [Riemerella columbipharyngis]SDE64497.1 EpsG family protein [Riemerella columbipharyngis]